MAQVGSAPRSGRGGRGFKSRLPDQTSSTLLERLQGSSELSLSSSPASGYSIVNAEYIDAAEQLLEGCPIVDSVSLYEALRT